MSLFPRATPHRTRRRAVGPGASRTRVDRHLFVADESIPLDHRQRQTCRSCHVLGEPGDARHYGPDEPTQEYPAQDPETRQLELRRYGERDED